MSKTLALEPQLAASTNASSGEVTTTSGEGTTAQTKSLNNEDAAPDKRVDELPTTTSAGAPATGAADQQREATTGREETPTPAATTPTVADASAGPVSVNSNGTAANKEQAAEFPTLQNITPSTTAGFRLPPHATIAVANLESSWVCGTVRAGAKTVTSSGSGKKSAQEFAKTVTASGAENQPPPSVPPRSQPTGSARPITVFDMSDCTGGHRRNSEKSDEGKIAMISAPSMPSAAGPPESRDIMPGQSTSSDSVDVQPGRFGRVLPSMKFEGAQLGSASLPIVTIGAPIPSPDVLNAVIATPFTNIYPRSVMASLDAQNTAPQPPAGSALAIAMSEVARSGSISDVATRARASAGSTRYHRRITPSTKTFVRVGSGDEFVLIESTNSRGIIAVGGQGHTSGKLAISPQDDDHTVLVRSTTMPNDFLVGPGQTVIINTKTGSDFGLVRLVNRAGFDGQGPTNIGQKDATGTIQIDLDDTAGAHLPDRYSDPAFAQF